MQAARGFVNVPHTLAFVDWHRPLRAGTLTSLQADPFAGKEGPSISTLKREVKPCYNA